MTEQEASVLSAVDIPHWVATHSELAEWGLVTDAAEIGDGNLNRVFRVRCVNGSFVLKQSMPYVRIDPTWALTPTRINHEALAYAEWEEVAPGVAPQLYCFDDSLHAIAVEDLAGHRVWREALAQDVVHGSAARDLGDFVARATHHTSSRSLPASRCAALKCRADNPVMTDLMDDVVFRFPYEDHPHNSWAADVAPLVDEIRSDSAYRAVVSGLRERWRGSCEALIHGDLHTGSVMVTDGSARVIDAEFSFYGPIAWDLGELIGNLLIAAIRGHVTGSARRAALDGLVGELWSGFEERWAELSTAAAGDVGWPPSLRSDAIGYAGLEMVRRVIGSGKADEIAALPASEHAAATGVMLRAGRELALRREELDPLACVDVVHAAARAG